MTLDIEVAGSSAPGADIVVYFTPDADQGFIDAVSTAIHDTENRPSVLSITYGSTEINWSQEAMRELDKVFQAAAKQNISIVCAAGDNGVTDGVDDHQAHVNFPASSPWVLACGGTQLTTRNGKTIFGGRVE